jgi:hypothetical protein
MSHIDGSGSIRNKDYIIALLKPSLSDVSTQIDVSIPQKINILFLDYLTKLLFLCLERLNLFF